MSHEYFNIKVTAIWEIIQKALPKLKSMVTIILETEF
ncbi:HepT-like ribonuclease domain-containing protein [Cognataquiflexum nitidum]